MKLIAYHPESKFGNVKKLDEDVVNMVNAALNITLSPDEGCGLGSLSAKVSKVDVRDIIALFHIADNHKLCVEVDIGKSSLTIHSN